MFIERYSIDKAVYINKTANSYNSDRRIKTTTEEREIQHGHM